MLLTKSYGNPGARRLSPTPLLQCLQPRAGLGTHNAIASGGFRTAADDTLFALELLHRLLGERSEEAGDAGRRQVSFADEEGLQSFHVVSLYALVEGADVGGR